MTTALEANKLEELIGKEGEELGTKIFLRWKAERDFYFFCSKIMGLEEAKDWAGRSRWDSRLHRKMCLEMAKEEDTMQMYPRGSMKSTIAKCWVVWKVLKSPAVRVGMWSKTARLVRKELNKIKMLFCLEAIKDLWPEFADRDRWKKDTEDALTTWRDDSAYQPQENQIEVWGIEATVTGHHYDYQFYDDVIDNQTVRSVTLMNKVDDWWEHMQALRDQSSKEKWIGTFYHHKDIYNRVINDRFIKRRNIFVTPAIINSRIQYTYFTDKFLADQKKKLGNYNFGCQYLLDPSPTEDKIFIPPYPLYETLPKDVLYYIAVDPAATTNEWSNQTAIVVGAIEKDKKNCIYYVECKGYKLDSSKISDLILQKIIRYRPKKVGIELGLQQALQSLIDLKIKEWENQHREYIRPEFVSLAVGKMDKTYKLERTIGAWTKEGRALFKRDMFEVFKQMDFYNPNSQKNDDDIIDACGMLIQTIEYFASHYWSNVKVNEEFNYTMEMLLKMNRDKERRWGYALAN